MQIKLIFNPLFGLNIGGAIGIALYLSQAISVAFYIIAFGEAFESLFNRLNEQYGFHIADRRWISIPTMALLSGDLKDPKKSIPKGTLWATFVGMLVYIAVAWKFTVSASPEELVSDQLVMRKIALWGPIVPVGLAAASLSSALGSI